MMQPIVTNLDDDNGDGVIDDGDTPDIVVVTYSNATEPVVVVRAVSGLDGSEIWDYAHDDLDERSGLAAGDLDGDGLVEVVASHHHGLVALENDGSLAWFSEIEHSMTAGATPAISDMDGDGEPEIVLAQAIFQNDGTLLGWGEHGCGGDSGDVGTTSLAVDLDRDGVQEVVVGDALYRSDGEATWYNGEVDGYLAVADFDDDGEGEIVVAAKVGDHSELRLQDTDGTVIWNVWHSNGLAGLPTIADFDGDDRPEIGLVAMGTHPEFVVLDEDGAVLWRRALSDNPDGTGAAAFDFDGDGYDDLVYADQENVWILCGADGSVRMKSTEHESGTSIEYPVVADVDGDGQVEIVVTNSPLTRTSSYRGITVYESETGGWPAGRRSWNQSAYHVTNVDDDGTIPAVADLNWDLYNSFRAQPAEYTGADHLPDLVIELEDVCRLECDRGRLVVWGRAGNQGLADVAGELTVSLWLEESGSWQEAASTTIDGVPAGELRESFVFDLAGLEGREITDLSLAIDGGDDAAEGGAWQECDESNNEATWGEDVCW